MKLATWKKILNWILVFTVIFNSLGLDFFVLNAPAAQAQGGPALAPGSQLLEDVFHNLADQAQKVKDDAAAQLKEVLLDLVATVFKNTLSQFLNKLAFETATWIASGDKGQKPLLFTSDWGSYLQGAGQDAVGNFVDALGGATGLNLCAPPSIILNLGLGIKSTYVPHKPKCNFNNLVQNWNVSSPQFLDKFGAKFNPEENDLSLSLGLNVQSDEKKVAAEVKAFNERINTAFKDVKNVVSGVIQTPGVIVGMGAQKAIEGVVGPGPAAQYTGRLVADVVTTFVSTLAAQYLKKLQSGLFTAKDLASKSSKNLSNPFGSGGASGGRQVAEDSFRNIATVSLKTIGEFNLVQDFATCPPDKTFAAPSNCTIDSGFVEALNATGEDTYLTVRDAMAKGFLHPDWPFGYSNPGGGVEPDVTAGYGHTAMLKLRRARIIPIGWEIAASRIRDDGNVYTLQQVVDGFQNPDSMFYHLVDPDWVLKAPQYLCRASVPGQILQSGTDSRKDYCADLQDCVVESSDGKTCLSWGYCTREKNTWRFAGASCPDYYSSCRTLTRTSDSTQFTFLTNTLDKDDCNASNAGCTWYSRSQTTDGTWLDENRIYLNKTAQECDSTDAGCREYLSLTNINSGMSVEDVVTKVTSDPAKADKYENYATVTPVYMNGTRTQCLFDEVGCQQFTPDNGDPAVTGVVSAFDSCPKECVGYNSYKQEKTFLESDKFPVYFIPKTAQSCSAQDVGCDQFTNLDRVEAGGEDIENYSYIRQCQKPAGDCTNYYTWVGSEDTGFQLRAFNLKASSLDGSGAPKTTDGSVACSDPSSPDCKQFFDAAGNVYFRDYKATISCSDRCFRYRMTTTTQADCLASNGNWDGANCVYTAIPEEGTKCSAQANGCREFKGNTGENVAFIGNSTFESGDTGGWTGGVLSDEAISAPGHSLKFNGSITIDVHNLVKPGKSYILSFYLKTPALVTNDISARFGHPLAVADRSSDVAIGALSVTNNTDWTPYNFGPIIINRDINTDENLIISVNKDSFIDNIILKEVQGLVYVTKNSWQTPATCDTNPPLPGGTASSSMVGCAAYTDKDENPHYLKSFSRLCDANKVGCEALVDTQNSATPFSQSFNDKDASAISVPADKVTYVVNDPAKSCTSDKKGCSALGLPTISSTGQATSFQTVYKIDDPDQYGTILCTAAHLFCEEYTMNDSLVYFKHPNDNICEFRAIPNTQPVEYAWFKKGDDTTPNPPECNDATTNEWAKTCPEDQNGCTEFYEPITQTSQFIIKDDKLDTSTCNGLIDWKQGCVLFDDKSIDAHTYTAYDIDKGINSSLFTGVSPTNCTTNGSLCDTNTLVHVQRDRTCAEWLACQSSAQVFDVQNNELRNICYGIGRCDKAKDTNLSECDEWVTDPYKTCQGGENINRPCKRDVECGKDTNGNFYKCDSSVLTEQLYQTRDTSFIGKDFDGMSLVGKYPVEKMQQINYGDDSFGRPIFGLTYLKGTGLKCPTGLGCPVDQICVNRNCFLDVGIDGTNSTANKTLGVEFKECRGYPETNSPFPNEVATFDEDGNVKTRQPGYDLANIAQKDEVAECSYRKVLYQNGSTRFIGEGSTPVDKVKSNGDSFSVVKYDDYLGWRGYCLEKDINRVINGNPAEVACLSWYPVDLTAGEVDIYNNYPGAGYVVSADKQYYCAASKVEEYRARYRIGNTDGSDLFDTSGGIAGGAAYFVGFAPGYGAAIAAIVNVLISLSSTPPTCEQAYGQICKDNGYSVARVSSFSCGALGDQTCSRCDCVPVDRNGQEREGWYQFNGPFGVEFTKPVRQVCTAVVRIDEGQPGKENKAWTSRIVEPFYLPAKNLCDSGPKQGELCVTDADCGTGGHCVLINTETNPGAFELKSLNYERNQDDLPFGVIKAPSTSEPGNWASEYKDSLGNAVPIRVVQLSEIINSNNQACPSSQACVDGHCGGPTGVECKSKIAECKDSECTAEGICKDGPEQGQECIPADAGDSPARSGSPLSLDLLGTIGGQATFILGGTLSALEGFIDVRNRIGKVPYKSNEQADAGYARLKQLFAKAYGNWTWEVGNNVCGGRCSGAGLDENYCIGGDKDGQTCTGNADCPGTGATCVVRKYFCQSSSDCDAEFIRTGVRPSYACQPKVCLSGADKGRLCSNNSDCVGGSCGDQGKCANGGATCSGDGDCKTGTCTAPTSFHSYCGTPDGKGLNVGNNCDKTGSPVGTPDLSKCLPAAGKCVVDLCTDGTNNKCKTDSDIGNSCGADTPSTRYTRDDSPIWDITDQGEQVQLHPTLYNRVTHQYAEDTSTGFSLNFKPTGDVVALGDSKSVAMQFYAYNANGQQMPLRSIEIDWDDEGQGNVYSIGSFKNHKHYCKLPEDPPDSNGLRYNFGDNPSACTDDSKFATGYFTFLHTYICTGPNSEGWKEYGELDGCAFKPRIRIKDNWGRCTTARCDDPQGWTFFPGVVIVRP